MKTIKSIAALVVFIFCIVSQFDGLSNSTTCQNITVEYENNVPDALARGLAKGLGIWGDNKELTLALRDEQDHYRLEMTIADKSLSDEFRREIEIYSRIWSDWYSPNKPLYVEVSSNFAGQLAVVKPVSPMGKIYVHHDNYLFYSENIPEPQAAEFAKGLEEVGYSTKEGGTMARITRTDDRYVVGVAFDRNDYESEDFRESMMNNADTIGQNLFGGVKTEIVYCEINLQPVGNDVSYTTNGFFPSQTMQRVDNIAVIHDEVITEEEAKAIATRFPGRNKDAEESQGWLQLTVSGHDHEYECRIPWQRDQVDGIDGFMGFYAREIFSAINEAKSLKLILVDTDETPLCTREVTDGNGERFTFHDNWLFYPKETPQPLVEKVVNVLTSTGTFEEDGGAFVRLTQEMDTDSYTLQIVVLPTEDLDPAVMKKELENLGRTFAMTAFANRKLTLEITNPDFQRLGEYVWYSDAEANEQKIATESESGDATASL